VYLAAPYYRKDEIQGYKDFLQDMCNVEVTARWMEEAHAPTTQMSEVGVDLHILYARNDLEDVYLADMVVSFTEPLEYGERAITYDFYNRAKRGGRHVEFGFGLALGREMVIVGPRENIFHNLPGVKQYDTFEDFVANHKMRVAA